ncbi:phage holin family protein [Flavonifractor sp. An100]|uniref:phage holin family protein n=1 Tax=Flavonifractor sp. An100 TaxID=1965538 RepID=UPI000B3AA531|nr:phage holin family protein [Flavonifractor sp. An100]OUQ79453.1 enolase [Flavonifractor sp. An100]
MEFGVASVAAITVICYLAGLVVKATPWNNDSFIPIVCGAAGGLLGLAALYLPLPDFPAGDPLTATAVGIVSGLAATGLDQAKKQLNH